MSFDFGPCADSYRSKKDWTHERQLAAKRGRVYLDHKWGGADEKGRPVSLYKVRFSRFCYADYRKGDMSIRETPDTLGFRWKRLSGSGEETRNDHFILSFRRGRLAVYRRILLGTNWSVRHSLPMDLDFAPPLKHRDAYPDPMARYHRRLVKLLRSKARANGVKLAKGDYSSVNDLLRDTLFPVMKDLEVAFQASIKPDDPTIYRDMGLGLDKQNQLLISRLRCTREDVVKSVTGWKGKALGRLFWEKVNPTDLNRWRTVCSWAALLRTWLPVDYTQQLFRAPEVITFPRTNNPEMKLLLTQFTPKKVLTMLTLPKSHPAPPDSSTLIDSVRSYRALKEANPAFTLTQRFDNLTEMHDWLAREARRLKDKDFPLKHEWAKDIEGKTILTAEGETYSLVTPKTSWELKEWGEQMSNCIGGYGHLVNNGHCTLLGLIREGVCHWGVELRGSEIVQFRGRFNAAPPPELQQQVQQIVREQEALSLTAETKQPELALT